MTIDGAKMGLEVFRDGEDFDDLLSSAWDLYGGCYLSSLSGKAFPWIYQQSKETQKSEDWDKESVLGMGHLLFFLKY